MLIFSLCTHLHTHTSKFKFLANKKKKKKKIICVEKFVTIYMLIELATLYLFNSVYLCSFNEPT